MENDTDGKTQNETTGHKKDFQSDPVGDVEEILRKAELEEDSDSEFLSAEDDSDSESFELNEEPDVPDMGVSEMKKEELPFSDEANQDEHHEEESVKVDKMAIRQKEEDLLTPEQKEEKRNRGQDLKAKGNTKFRDGDYNEAIEAYSEALEICPLNFHRERAIMFANRAACKMKKEEYQEAIDDSTNAIELHPQYLKALLRRAELYEKTEKLDEALKDYEKVVELDPSHHPSRAACMRLAEQIKERNEKMKEEMIGKLKDLGNLVLRPFGLNVNNFNLQQDPNSGSYSVQFRQNPTGNGNGS